MNTWIIIAEEGPVSGVVQAARGLGGTVTAAVVGPRSLADTVATAGVDEVRWFPAGTDTGLPPEALAGPVADAVAEAGPRVVLSPADSAARVLLAAAAVKLNAALVASAATLAADGDDIVVTRLAIEDKVVETLAVTGPLAATFEGDDPDAAPGAAASVTEMPTTGAAPLKVVEQVAADGQSAGLLQADRVVGVGLGILKRDDLALIDNLAAALGAEIACSLPLVDDMRWYDESRVVGTSTNQISPDLYIAVGVSGQPQHMSGVRKAKVVVAINNDPKATIFKHCDYGIEGDLYKVVPVLTEAIGQAKS